MRHGDKINNLGRKAAHRKPMLANMACSLIEHKRINTTLAKAKALKVFVEPLITKSKEDTTHNRRVVFSRLHNKYAVTELFRNISVKVANRPGGYTRIIKERRLNKLLLKLLKQKNRIPEKILKINNHLFKRWFFYKII